MPKILLSVDPGGSQTKVIYQLPKQNKPQCLLMPPEIETIRIESLVRYLDKQSSLSNPDPDKEAYIYLNDKVYVLGEFAHEFDPEDRITEIKYENALYKVLAALGVILESNQIKSKNISLYLSILLPWNEYEDRDKFRSQIEKYLANFKFRKNDYSAKLDLCIFRPEGGGLAGFKDAENKDWHKDKRVGFIMFGHRNITALNFDRGKLIGDSPLIGMSKFLDGVIERTSGLNREKLARAISEAIDYDYQEKLSYGYRGNCANRDSYSYKHSAYYRSEEYARNTYLPFFEKCPSIQGLANAKNLELREKEIKEICSAINDSRLEYQEKVEKFLNRMFPEQLDEVIISGGGVKFLLPYLEKYFQNSYDCKGSKVYYERLGLIRKKPYIKSYRTEEPDYIDKHFLGKYYVPITQKQVDFSELIEIKSYDKSQSIYYRLMDVYGVFKILSSKK